jgi:hypothetical protein
LATLVAMKRLILIIVVLALAAIAVQKVTKS